jgi:hypothetical protein
MNHNYYVFSIHLFACLVCCLICCISGGCQRGLQVQMVEGRVTLDGKVVADADVCFTPKADMLGISAVGTTDANGNYRLTSAQGGVFGKGAVTGEYEVRIIKFKDLNAIEPVNPKIGDSVPLANPKHHLPEKYANVKTSGLTATVKEGKNTIDFNLTQ